MAPLLPLAPVQRHLLIARLGSCALLASFATFFLSPIIGDATPLPQQMAPYSLHHK
jgi:hypothetical protein